MTTSTAPTKESSPLGLKLDTRDVLATPPAIILYGPAGAGKSTAMARAFPNCLYVQTAPTVLRPYAHWLETHKSDPKIGALKVPDRITLPKYAPGEPGKILDPRPSLKKIVSQYMDACAKGTCPYEGIVFDEWTEMAWRIYESIKADPTYGRNNFKRSDAIKEIHYEMAELARATNRVVGLVCHEMEPLFDLEEGSPTYGSLKYRGGPKMPVKALSHEVSAAVDIVLRIEVTGNPPVRQFCTAIKSDWTSKLRADGLPMYVDVDLRKLLADCGYPSYKE